MKPGANASRFEPRIVDGKQVMVPIPFPCGCGEPACYGNGVRWYCTGCWQSLCAKGARLMPEKCSMTPGEVDPALSSEEAMANAAARPRFGAELQKDQYEWR